jgi:hypothetical protein
MDLSIFKTFFIEFVLLARNVTFLEVVKARNVGYPVDLLRRIRLTSNLIHSQKEIKMFKNRFLIVLGLLFMLLVATAVSRPFLNVQESPRPVMIPVTNADYFSDYFQRHTERASNLQDMVIPITGSSESSDYFQRHPELNMPAGANAAIDMTDYFLRHLELRTTAESEDLSDYFLRH